MPWYLHLALRQLFPTGRRFPFFTLISVLGVALGVALLLVVMSVMGGFAFEIRHMIVDTEGEIQVKAAGPVSDYPAVVRRVESVPGVAAATPYALDAVMVKFGDKPAFPMLRGLDTATVGKVTKLDSYLVEGSLDDLDDDSVILSDQIARSLGANVGDSIEVYSPAHHQQAERRRALPAQAGARRRHPPHRPPAAGQQHGVRDPPARPGPVRPGIHGPRDRRAARPRRQRGRCRGPHQRCHARGDTGVLVGGQLLGLPLGPQPGARDDLLPPPLHRHRGRVLRHELPPHLGRQEDARDRPPGRAGCPAAAGGGVFLRAGALHRRPRDRLRPRAGVRGARLAQRCRPRDREGDAARGGAPALLPVQRAAVAHLGLDGGAHRAWSSPS